MTTQTVQTAKVLEVTALELNDNKESEYTFRVYEFANGLILVPGESSNDWFFEDRDSIELNGTDSVIRFVQDTGETCQWTAQTILQSVQGSMREFGVNSVPAKHFELWK